MKDAVPKSSSGPQVKKDKNKEKEDKKPKEETTTKESKVKVESSKEAKSEEKADGKEGSQTEPRKQVKTDPKEKKEGKERVEKDNGGKVPKEEPKESKEPKKEEQKETQAKGGASFLSFLFGGGGGGGGGGAASKSEPKEQPKSKEEEAISEQSKTTLKESKPEEKIEKEETEELPGRQASKVSKKKVEGEKKESKPFSKDAAAKEPKSGAKIERPPNKTEATKKEEKKKEANKEGSKGKVNNNNNNTEQLKSKEVAKEAKKQAEKQSKEPKAPERKPSSAVVKPDSKEGKESAKESKAKVESKQPPPPPGKGIDAKETKKDAAAAAEAKEPGLRKAASKVKAEELKDQGKAEQPKEKSKEGGKPPVRSQEVDQETHAIGAKSHDEMIRSHDYEKLKEELLGRKALFKDEAFPHEKHGEYFTQGRLAGKEVKWLRPHDICPEPHFIEGGATKLDIAQGKLSDCWFIAAVSTMTSRKSLFEKFVPLQSFTKDYAGIFHFRFYLYGEWIDVVIDDYLPTVDGALVLGHSASKNEFWLALLEKAYAKKNGGFETLNFGNASEAFVDFTGGVAEIFTFPTASEVPANLFAILYRYYLRNSLVCTYISRKDGKVEDELTNGLILKHEYALTGMCRLWYKGKLVRLVRLRNPWGKCEWRGPWADGSVEWASVTAEVKEKIGLKKFDDGEFWMPYTHFIEHFNVFECCHVVSSTGPLEVSTCETYMWNFYEQTGGWLGPSAGGCANHMDSFVNNPMYVLTIVEPDVEDEEGDENNFNTVIISLIQKFFRYRKTIKKEAPIRIGFSIYFVGDLTEEDQKKGGSLEAAKKEQFTLENFFKASHSIAKIAFAESRAVSGRFQLQPARYLIIPSTFSPGDEASYLLRVLVSKSPENREAYKSKHANHIPVVDFAAKAPVNMPKTRSPKKSRPTSKKSTGSSKSNRSAKGVVASKKPLTPKNAFDNSGKVKASKRAASPCATGLRNFAVEVNKCKQAAKLQRMTSKVKTVVAAAAAAKEPKKEEAKEGKAAKTEPKSKEGNGKETTTKKDTELKKQPPEKASKELEERKPSQVKTNNSKVSEKILKEEVAKESKGKAAEELVAKDNNNDNSKNNKEQQQQQLQERKQSKVKTDPKETKTKDAAKEGK